MSTAEAEPTTTLNPSDFLDTDWLLSDEEKLIRDNVRTYVRKEVLPHVGDWFDRAELPARELAKGFGDLGLLGMHLTGYGCAGASAMSYGLAVMELEAGDSGIRSLVSVQGSLAMYAIWKYGSEEQKQQWLPGMAAGDADRLLRPHRARLRLEPRRHAHERPAQGRRLGPQRPEDVDHQRLDRRRRRGVGAHRGGCPRLRRPDGHARLQRARHPQEDVAARVGDERARARRRAPARPTRSCPSRAA